MPVKDPEKIFKLLKKSQKDKTMLGNFSERYPPWKILISTILSARANDKTTIPISRQLFKRYTSLKKLAHADIRDIKEIIKPIGYYNQKSRYLRDAAKILIKEYCGKVPKDKEKLTELPGVGNKVAGCVLVYAFDKADLIPIDTHCHRVANRIGWADTEDAEHTRISLEHQLSKKFWKDLNEVFVLHGQNICKPVKPLCFKCPISRYCEYEDKNL